MADKHEIDFEGQTFEVQTGDLNQFLLMQFMAFMADVGPDAEVPWTLLMKMLRASIVKADWRRFEKLGEQTDDFMAKSMKILEARMAGPVEKETGHPTGQPSVSTDGPKVMPLRSVSVSDAKVIELSHGRPDRYWMLKEAQKASAARSA